MKNKTYNINKYNFNFTFLIYWAFLCFIFLFVSNLMMQSEETEDVSADYTGVHTFKVKTYIRHPNGDEEWQCKEEGKLWTTMNSVEIDITYKSGSDQDGFSFDSGYDDNGDKVTNVYQYRWWSTLGSTTATYSYKITQTPDIGYKLVETRGSCEGTVTMTISTKWNGATSHNVFNHTVSFYYEPKTYPIEYDYNGGSAGELAPSTFYHKEPVEISNPNRTGYSFDGWTTNLSNSFIFNYGPDSNNITGIPTSGSQKIKDTWFVIYMLKEDIIPKFTAHWTANKYTVTLNRNGGSGGSSTVTATYDSAMPNVKIPSNGGYQFLGYWDSSGTQYYNANGNSVRNWNKASDATLYAKWERYNYKIDINFYKPDGSTQNGGTFDLYKQLSGGSKTLIQKGLSNELSGSEYLQYEGKFILEKITPLTGTTISSVSLKNSNGTLSTSGNPINTITYTASQTGPPSGDWDNAILIYTSTNNVQANFNYNGGTVVKENDSQPYSSNGTYLSEIPPKKDMSRTGYTFIGWNTVDDGSGKYYTSSTNFNNSSQVEAGHCVATANAGNIEFTLYAIWEANEYKVTLDQQGGSDGTTTITATYDSAMPTITVPSKFGYTFEGYYDSSGTKYYNANGTSARNWDKANTATLYAQWTPYSYTLTLNGNGGTTKTGQQTITQSGSYASTLTLDSKPFIQKGYIFKGWSTTKDGAVKYLDGANYSSLITSNPTSITLYAQWEETIASGITEVYEDAGTYYINTVADLAKLIYTTENKAVGNGYIFIQTANIDLSGLTYLPIGRLKSFSGTYDGQGYTISGLSSYNGTDAEGNYLESNGGLFANAGGAKIKNVIIEDATIYGQNAGIIAGSGNADTNISNCVVSGTVNGTNAGSIIGNGNGASISACLAKGVNTASFAGGSASVDSCIYELTGGTKGASGSFNNYSAWIYPSNFAYPMPKAFMWYPYPELTKDSLNTWLSK